MISRIINDENVRIIFILLGIKIALQAYFYYQGFVSVSADEFQRGMLAARWAIGDLPTTLYTGTWLPFERYLNGLSLMIWDNVILAPRLTAFIFSCFLLVYFVKLVQYLFDLKIVTITAGLLLIFNPWYIWLSGTPMLDIYYLALIIGGIYYLIKWTNTNFTRYIVISAILLFFSTGFHFQSWILINSINLACCYFIWERYKEKRYKDIFILIGFFIANNLFIFTYITAEIIATGEFLYFVDDHTVGTKLYYAGYELPLLNKLYYYPKLIFIWGNLLLVFLPIGLYWLGSKTNRITKLFPFIIGCITLIVFCLFNVFSVPASAAPGRYSLPFILLFIPYSALGIYALFQQSGYFTNITFRRVVGAAVVIFILAANFARASYFPSPNDWSDIKVGYYVNDLLESENTDSNTTAMLELTYWDFISIQLAARNFDKVILDREYELETADNMENRIQSIFLTMEDEDIVKHLREKNTKYVLVRDQLLKNRLNSFDFMHKFDEVEGWNFYEVNLDRIE